MRHDIRDTGCSLIRRQGLGQCRIQDTEFRTDGIAAGTPLEHPLFFRDDGIGAAFASCCGNGEDRTHGKCLLDRFSAVEIPEITVIKRSRRNGLGGIDGTASADGQHKVHAFLPAELDPFIHKTAPGIRLHTSQHHIGDPLLLQGCFHPVQKS